MDGLEGVADQGWSERQVQHVQPELEILDQRSRIVRGLGVLDFGRNRHTVSQVAFQQPEVKIVNGGEVL